MAQEIGHELLPEVEGAVERNLQAAASGDGGRRVVGHAGQVVSQAVAVDGEGQYLQRGAVGVVLYAEEQAAFELVAGSFLL